MRFSGVLLAVAVVGGVGLFIGLFLGIAAIKFKVEVDEKGDQRKIYAKSLIQGFHIFLKEHLHKLDKCRYYQNKYNGL